METTRNPFTALAAFIIGTLFIVGLVWSIFQGVQRGIIALPPAQLTVNGQQPAARPVAPGLSQRPALAPPVQQAQPVQEQLQAAPTAGPVYQPTGNDVPAPGEAAPAGAPMTDEYKASINAQQRMNDKGELCLPRSGCTKPGSGGALAWPSGRP